MNKRFIPVLAIGSAIAITFASCSEEKVTMNQPSITNNLTIDGEEARQITSNCTQSSSFSISASLKIGSSNGSFGIDFPGGMAPMPDTFTVVASNPQPGQVRMQVLPDVQNPSQSYIGQSGRVILTIVDNGYRATFNNITMAQTDSASNTIVVSGSVGCYNANTGGTTGGGNTGNNSITFGTNAAIGVTASCMPANGSYMIQGGAQNGGVIFAFDGDTAPDDGTYTLKATPGSLAANEVYFVATIGTTIYEPTGGQATVSTVSGKKKVTISNVPIKASGGTATTTVSGSVGCP